MRHPFESIQRRARPRLFPPLLVAAALVLAAWVVTVAPMSTKEAPLSVSSFGTAGSPARARAAPAGACGRGRRGRRALTGPGPCGRG